MVDLIQELRKRGHRQYAELDMEAVRKHAEKLVPHAKSDMDPQVPKEVLAVLRKKLNVDDRRPGKAAALTLLLTVTVTLTAIVALALILFLTLILTLRRLHLQFLWCRANL